jgi:hypothetical protein
MNDSNKVRHFRSGAAVALSLVVAVFPLAEFSGAAQGQTRADLNYSTAQPANKQDRQREIQVNALSATLANGGVVLQWRTTFELDNLGFDIYRVRNGQRTRANRSLILGSIFNARPGLPLGSGYSYSWFDPAGTADAVYYVESISADGLRKLHETSAIVSSSKLPESLSPDNINQSSGPFQLMSQSPASASPSGVPAPQGTIQNQWVIAGQSGLKIQIKQDGWYRLTQQQMSAAGFNPIVDIRNLSLYINAKEIAIRTSKNSGQFGSGDYIEFYGQGLDTKESDARIYYLLAGTQPGKRALSETHIEVAPVTSPVDLGPAFEPRGVIEPLFNFIMSGATAPRGKNETVSEFNVVAAPPRVDEPVTNSNTVEAVPLPQPTNARLSEAKAKVVTTAAAAPSQTPATSSAPERSVQIRSRRASVKNRKRRTRKGAQATKRRFAHAANQPTALAASFNNTVQITERFNYLFSLLNGDAQNYFGQPVYAFGTALDTLAIHNIQTSATVPAILEVAIQGVSPSTHSVSVFFNDVLVGTMNNYSGLEHGVQAFNIPVAQLLDGNNTVKMTAPSGDTGLVDYVRLTYPHKYTADSNSLRFSVPYNQSAIVDGFSTPNVMLLDISDPANVKVTNPAAQVSGSGYAIAVKKTHASTLGIPEQQLTRTVYALPQGQFLQPAALSLNQPSTLNQSTNGADILIVSYKDFIPSLSKNLGAANTSFVAQRLGQGLTSQIVDVEDIFDEFSYGTHTVQALVDFFSRASTTWNKKPRYLLLLGDASYDPRNYEGFGNWDLVPTKHVDTLFEDTCTDELLADFDGDGISNISLGRLPARTAAEADLMLSKIINFSKTNVPQTAMLVADAQDGYYFSFADSNVAVAALLPQPQINVQFVNRGEGHTPSTDAATRTTIINNFNQGVALANYSGHGNVDAWTGAQIFTAPDARALTNGNKLTFVVVADCLNGLFDDRNLEGIGEAFIKAPNGGAVATFSSSGKTTPEGQQAMAQSLYQLIYGSQPTALGDAIKQAKSATSDMDVRHTWIFLGDPTMKIW